MAIIIVMVRCIEIDAAFLNQSKILSSAFISPSKVKSERLKSDIYQETTKTSGKTCQSNKTNFLLPITENMSHNKEDYVSSLTTTTPNM